MRGEDLTDDVRVDRQVVELPLALQPWEPSYPVAEYKASEADFGDPPSAAGWRAYDAQPAPTVEDPETRRALVDMRLRGQHVEDHARDTAAQDVGNRLGDSTIGDVLDIDAGHALQQLHRHVRRGSDPGRAIAELAGLAPGQRDELFRRLGRDRRMNDERLRQLDQLRHRHEHFGHVVGHRLTRDMHRRGGARREIERIAVGR